MNIKELIREAFTLVKAHYVLAIPTAMVTVAYRFLALAMVQKQGDISGLMTWLFIGMVLNYVAHGATMTMAKDVFGGRDASLVRCWQETVALSYSFVVAAVAITIIVFMGFFVFILPGIIAMLLLMFAYPAIVVYNLGPFECLSASYQVVRANPAHSLQLFASLFVLSLAVGLVGGFLDFFPVVGQLAGVVLSGFAGGMFAVMLLRAYGLLVAKAQAA